METFNSAGGRAEWPHSFWAEQDKGTIVTFGGWVRTKEPVPATIKKKCGLTVCHDLISSILVPWLFVKIPSLLFLFRDCLSLLFLFHNCLPWSLLFYSCSMTVCNSLVFAILVPWLFVIVSSLLFLFHNSLSQSILYYSCSMTVCHNLLLHYSCPMTVCHSLSFTILVPWLFVMVSSLLFLSMDVFIICSLLFLFRDCLS